MTYGIDRRLHRFGCILIAFAGLGPACLPATASEPAWSLDQLMQALSNVKSATSEFVEDQYIGVLTRPLHASGVLVYVAPKRLEKDVLAPARQSVVIDGDTLTMHQSNGRSRSFMLQDHPEIGGFVESLRSTLSGDLIGLNRFYTVGFTSSADRWELSLAPKDEQVRKLVKSILIDGSNLSLSSVKILQADGDRTIMTLTRSHS